MNDPVYALLTWNLPEEWSRRFLRHSEKKGLGFDWGEVRVWLKDSADDPVSRVVHNDLKRHKGFVLYAQFEYAYPGTGKYRTFHRCHCTPEALDERLRYARAHLKSFRGE